MFVDVSKQKSSILRSQKISEFMNFTNPQIKLNHSRQINKSSIGRKPLSEKSISIKIDDQSQFRRSSAQGDIFGFSNTKQQRLNFLFPPQKKEVIKINLIEKIQKDSDDCKMKRYIKRHSSLIRVLGYWRRSSNNYGTNSSPVNLKTPMNMLMKTSATTTLQTTTPARIQSQKQLSFHDTQIPNQTEKRQPSVLKREKKEPNFKKQIKQEPEALRRAQMQNYLHKKLALTRTQKLAPIKSERIKTLGSEISSKSLCVPFSYSKEAKGMLESLLNQREKKPRRHNKLLSLQPLN